MRGAFVPVCCLAMKYSGAIQIIEAELLEIHLKLVGVEELYDERYFHGIPSDEMKDLIQKLDLYPVQFREVHYFPPDT